MNPEKSRELKIKVLQYMYGELEYFRWSERINRHYCDRHGYEYVISREQPQKGRHICWHKIPVILSELQDSDFLLFIDADAHFYSLELKIEEQLIPLMNGKDILMAQDIASEQRRWNPGKPNSGVMLMRVNEPVRNFLETWDKASDVDESTRWKWPPTQLALWNVVMPAYPDFVEVCPEYYLVQGHYGLCIRHYMFKSNTERMVFMKSFCQSRHIGTNGSNYIS